MDRFDSLASSWDEDPANRERSRAIASAIRSLVPLSRGMRALEIGSGTGLLGIALLEDVGSLLALDTSAGMVDVLRDKIREAGLSGIEALRGDVGDLPAGSRFSIAFSQMALHHIADVDSFLDSVREVLEPGGWLCLADLDTEDGSFHGPDVPDVHLGFDRAELVQGVAGRGFDVVDVATVFEVQRRGRSYPVFLLVARKA